MELTTHSVQFIRPHGITYGNNVLNAGLWLYRQVFLGTRELTIRALLSATGHRSILGEVTTIAYLQSYAPESKRSFRISQHSF
jgi:hypothetical protein